MTPAASNPALAAALKWAAAGRRVFPLVPGEKRPAVAWSTEATTDPEQIRFWFGTEHAPSDAGLGLPTGEGLVVLDIDVAKGGTIPSWAEATYTVATRSGGWHLYYRVPEAVEVHNSVSRIAPGVDVRGDGGYVVAPPTPGWKVAVNAPITFIEPELLTAVMRESGEFTRDQFDFPERDENGDVPDERKVGEGERNDWLLRACGHARESGITDEPTLLAVALEYNTTYILDPLDEPEVRQVVRSSLRYLEAR